MTRRPAGAVVVVVALGLAGCATFAVAQQGGGGPRGVATVPATAPRPGAVLRLNAGGRLPARAIPTVGRARAAPRADRTFRLGELSRADIAARCPDGTLDLGTWCLARTADPQPATQAGAARACGERGGILPAAALLAGARRRAGLPASGELTGSLVTTDAGSSAAGTSGPTLGSRGDPRAGEPDPTPIRAEPEPDTLHHLLVGRDGFAGSRSVGTPGPFRCAFFKGRQGPQQARPAPAPRPTPALGRAGLTVRSVRLRGRTLTLDVRAGAAGILSVELRGAGRRLVTQRRTVQATTRRVSLRLSATAARALARRGPRLARVQLRVTGRPPSLMRTATVRASAPDR